MAGQMVSPSLQAEGSMMLHALLDDLQYLPDVQILVPLDFVYANMSLPECVKVIPVQSSEDVFTFLPVLIQSSDAIWPIAPENDGISFASPSW